MTDIPRAFLDQSRHLLLAEYLPKIERCLGELSDEDVWWRPNEASNSIGNLLLHLCGNLRQWIIGGVGQRPFERQRQQEFDERSLIPRQELLARLKATLQEVDDVLAGVDPESLLTTRQIQDFEGTILEAIYHVVEHFAMHSGQIITVTKMRAGRDLKLWP
jgi:uncharacterized damage-inducible protein DinB